MNIFYFDDKTETIVKTKPINRFAVINTNKTFDCFVEDYETARTDGNSIIDYIEWAR